MRRVILESPYAPKVPADLEPGTEAYQTEWKRQLHYNVTYARLAMRDCLTVHKDAPSASHLLYTQPGVLDDTIPEERTMGIEAGLEWRNATDTTVVYLDRGISSGMIYGVEKARNDGKTIVYRRLPESVLRENGIPLVQITHEQITKLCGPTLTPKEFSVVTGHSAF